MIIKKVNIYRKRNHRRLEWQIIMKWDILATTSSDLSDYVHLNLKINHWKSWDQNCNTFNLRTNSVNEIIWETFSRYDNELHKISRFRKSLGVRHSLRILATDQSLCLLLSIYIIIKYTINTLILRTIKLWNYYFKDEIKSYFVIPLLNCTQIDSKLI